MPLFFYEAIDNDGETVNGELNVPNKEEAVGVLARKKLTPIKIETRETKEAGLIKHQLFERYTTLDRIILVRNLAATIRAGLSIIEALDILIADSTKNIGRSILMTAKINVQNGQQLSETFAYYSKYFPSIFVGMIKAGETSGQLDKTLGELSQHMTKEYNLLKKVKSALTYPAILLTASIGIVIMLLTFVLPRLTKTFSQSNVELPFLTKVLMNLSKLITYNFWLDFLVLGGLVWFFVYFRKTILGKRFFSFLAFNIPVSRNLIKKIVLVRLTRTLGSLIASGLPISESLALTAKAVGNERYEKTLVAADNDIRNGQPLSDTLRKYPELFPRFLTSLVAVGERTGTLEEVLKTFADFYDDDVDSALKDLTTFLEPLLLLLMGLIVGMIALSILMPIYQLVGKFV